jgi:hypothetical protein
LALAVEPSSAAVIGWTLLDDPMANGHTYGTAIDGNNLVGYYLASSGVDEGFVYDGNNWTTLIDPSAGPTGATIPSSIAGSTVVGFYYDSIARSHGFEYDLNAKTWTTLDNPSATKGSAVLGISGSRVVGNYSTAVGNFGYLYDGTSWITLSAPGANFLGGGTVPKAISGNLVAGFYQGNLARNHGFLYNLATQSWTALDDPLVPPFGSYDTLVTGISGDYVVGSFNNGVQHGFLYKISSNSWTTLDLPGSNGGTYFDEISGTTAAGTFDNGLFGQGSHAFIAQNIPEPPTIVSLLFAISLVGTAARAFALGSEKDRQVGTGKRIERGESTVRVE